MIDGPAGMWCVNIGHGRREIADAIARQAAEMAYFSPWSVGNAPAARLAEKMAALAPGDLNHVFFSSGGSTAVDSALRFVMFYNNYLGRPEKKQIISRQGRLSRQHLSIRFLLGQGAGQELARLRRPCPPPVFAKSLSPAGRAIAGGFLRRQGRRTRGQDPRDRACNGSPLSSPNRFWLPAASLCRRPATTRAAWRSAGATMSYTSPTRWSPAFGRLGHFFRLGGSIRHRPRHHHHGQGPDLGLSCPWGPPLSPTA